MGIMGNYSFGTFVNLFDNWNAYPTAH